MCAKSEIFSSLDSILDETANLVKNVNKINKSNKFSSNINKNSLENTKQNLIDIIDNIELLVTSRKTNAIAYNQKNVLEKIKKMNHVVFIQCDHQLRNGVSSKSIQDTKILVDNTVDMFTKIRKMDKPQMNFKKKHENDETPYIPNLTEKYNSLAPANLDTKEMAIQASAKLSISVSDKHPYILENLMNIPQVEDILALSDKEPIQLPYSAKDTPIIWIDDVDSLLSMVNDLEQAKIIAYDLEAHNHRTYLGFTCLIQISTRERDYIIDAIKLHDELNILNKIFTDRNILKIGHSTSHDNIWLQRDFNIFVVNLFDTQVAGEVLHGYTGGLAKLAKEYLSLHMDKSFQLADWRKRPLPKDMIEYARMDAHCLIRIFDQMMSDLSDPQHNSKIHSIIMSSKSYCLKLYQKPTPDINLTLKKLNWKFVTEIQKQCSKELMIWREKLSREIDENPNLLVPTNTIFLFCTYLYDPFEDNVKAYHSKCLPALRHHIYGCKNIYIKYQKKLLRQDNNDNILHQKSDDISPNKQPITNIHIQNKNLKENISWKEKVNDLHQININCVTNKKNDKIRKIKMSSSESENES